MGVFAFPLWAARESICYGPGPPNSIEEPKNTGSRSGSAFTPCRSDWVAVESFGPFLKERPMPAIRTRMTAAVDQEIFFSATMDSVDRGIPPVEPLCSPGSH